MKYTFEIKEMPALHLACCQHLGQYDHIGEAFMRLEKWATPKGLMNEPEAKVIALYYDDPFSTPIEKLRSDACISIHSSIETNGEICTKDMPKGLFAVGHFELKIGDFPEAWQLTTKRLVEEGYTCTVHPPYEIYHNNAAEHPKHLWIIDICIPITKA